MSELRDPAIKLFGKTISLPLNQQGDASYAVVDSATAVAAVVIAAGESCSDHKLVSSSTTTSREDYSATEGDGDKVCV